VATAEGGELLVSGVWCLVSRDERGKRSRRPPSEAFAVTRRGETRRDEMRVEGGKTGAGWAGTIAKAVGGKAEGEGGSDERAAAGWRLAAGGKRPTSDNPD
jgi:hypothetical protein